jgi:tetratricopeptide (TPR) repeat protein
MGFAARKSFKVMPGVRMTVSKSGVSTSVGTRGARVTRTASGRVTRTVGLPGSGLSHTKTVSGGASRREATPPQASRPAKPVKPGLMAPKWEKELHSAITEQHFEELPRIAEAYPEAAGIAATLDGLVAMQAGETSRALEVCRWAWSAAGDVGEHPFVRKYIGRTTVTIAVASGVEAPIPFGRDALGLALAELEQDAGNVDEAIAVVEALDPSAVAAVSLCELYLEAGRNGDVVDLTNGMANTDDSSALLVTFRAIALREQGHYVAAREAFKEALKSKSRDSAIRHKALVERAETYVKENRLAMARKDLERVLAEDATVPGVRERLADLSQP